MTTNPYSTIYRDLHIAYNDFNRFLCSVIEADKETRSLLFNQLVQDLPHIDSPAEQAVYSSVLNYLTYLNKENS